MATDDRLDLGDPPRPPGTRAGILFILRRLAAFSREFAHRVGVGRLVASFLLILAAAATEGVGLALLVPFIQLLDGKEPAGEIARFVDRVFAEVGRASPSLPWLLAAFIGLIVARAAILALRDRVFDGMNLAFVAVLRRSLYRAITEARWSFLVKERLSDLHKILTLDIEHVGHGTYVLLRIPALVVLGIVQLAVAFWLSFWLTLGVLAWGGAILWLLQRRFGRHYQKGLGLAEADRATFAESGAVLQALKLVKSYGAEARHLTAFDAVLARQGRQRTEIDRDSVAAVAALQIASAITLGAFVLAATGVAQLDAASVLVMVVIFARLAPLFTDMQQSWQAVVQMLPVFDGIVAARARCRAAVDALRLAVAPMVLRQDVRFENVGFRYREGQGPNALQNMDLTVSAGAVVAVVGPTGAGKSTLADLLLGLLAPTTGRILIDGVPLAGALRDRWRRSVGYVPQDGFLFNDTVRANLLWAAPSATDEDVRRALSLSAADRFCAALPEGLDTVVGERGARLSGGERQRLTLARALIGRPTLLVLDEATSALDRETERAVQSALDGLRGATTIVVIAHRLSTIRNADHVIVLDRGRLVEASDWMTLSRGRPELLASLFGAGPRTSA